MATKSRKPRAGAPNGWEGAGAPAQPGIVLDLALIKLAASGLDESDMVRLGMAAVDHVKATELLGFIYPDAGLHIPYWDPRDPTKPLGPAPKWPQSFRVRRLPTKEREAGLTEADKKYLAPSKSSLSAYFPTNLDWTTILDDENQDLIITEGELKAAKTCKEGYPCIGLGGVSAISSAARGVTFLEILETINWVKRRVTIIFDSDIEVNEDVIEAHNRLVDKLKDRGADVYSAVLPRTQAGGKQGLDDWFVNNPGVDFLTSVMAAKVPVTEFRAIQTLRRQYAYVATQDLVFDMNTKTASSRPAFNVAVSNNNFEVFKFDTEAMTFKARKADIGTAYLSSPNRVTVHTLDYRPGEPLFVTTDEGHSALNTWQPRPYQPVKGDVTAFKRLIQAQVDMNDPHWATHCKWLTQRLAYPYRYPGQKLKTAIVIYGEEGTGKSTVGEIMMRLYGANGGILTQQDIESAFNVGMANKEFLLCDEVANRKGKIDMVTKFKAFIAAEHINVNQKNQKVYTARSYEQYYITTNEDDAIVMSREDRRYFIGRNTGEDREVVRLVSDIFKAPNRSKVKDLAEFEAARTAALEAIAHYLMYEVDLSDFEPFANPPRTQAKEQMTIVNRSNAELFIQDAYDTPELLVENGVVAIKESFTTFESITLAYGVYQDKAGLRLDHITRNGFGSLMKKVGFRGYKFKGGSDAGKTVYPFKDHAQWTAQKVAEVFNCAVAATTGDTTTYVHSGKVPRHTRSEYEKLVEAAGKILDPAFRAKRLEAIDRQFKVPKKK